MLIKLATAYDPGDKDPGKKYDHALLCDVRWVAQSERIHAAIKLGTLDKKGAFVGGTEPIVRVVVKDRPRLKTTAYTDMGKALHAFGSVVHAAIADYDERWKGTPQ